MDKGMESHKELHNSNITQAEDDYLRREYQNLVQKYLLSLDVGDSRSTHDNYLSHAQEDEDLQRRSSFDVEPHSINHRHGMTEIGHNEDMLGQHHPLHGTSLLQSF